MIDLSNERRITTVKGINYYVTEHAADEMPEVGRLIAVEFEGIREYFTYTKNNAPTPGELFVDDCIWYYMDELEEVKDV